MSRQANETPDASRMQARAGFTIVELLVALMIFAVGMLGLAATAGSVTRMMGGAKRQVIAATVAQTRLERLRSSPCASITSGSDTTRGVISTWTVSAVTRGMNITERVSFQTSKAGLRTRTYMTTIAC
jgi:type IV pilus modification protein PilV